MAYKSVNKEGSSKRTSLSKKKSIPGTQDRSRYPDRKNSKRSGSMTY